MEHFDIKHFRSPVIFAAEYGLLGLCYACEVNLNVLRPSPCRVFQFRCTGVTHSKAATQHRRVRESIFYEGLMAPAPEITEVEFFSLSYTREHCILMGGKRIIAHPPPTKDIESNEPAQLVSKVSVSRN